MQRGDEGARTDSGGSPPIRSEVRARLCNVIRSDLRRERRRKTLASVVGVFAAFGVGLVLARYRSPSAHDWHVALGLASGALGCAVAAASRRLALLVVAGGPALALATAGATAGPGDVAAAVGAHCLATELVCASVVVGGTWLTLRRGTGVLGGRAAGATAAAGALAGLASLELTCPGRAAFAHLLLFHVLGVLAASGAAAALWTSPPPQSTRRTRIP
jgi:hypothetical protein